LLCDPDDVITLAGNLVSASFDSDVRAELLAEAATQLATFSWQRCAADLTSLYRRLAEHAV
jgi:hypothetical protein